VSIRHRIDTRFTITKIKQIIRQLNTPFNLINTTTSQTTRQMTLFIGIRDPANIQTYESATKKFFNKDHYNELHRQP